MKTKPNRKNFHKEHIFTLEQNKVDFDYIEQIQKKAYELYENRGCEHGYHEEDWHEAERLVKGS